MPKFEGDLPKLSADLKHVKDRRVCQSCGLRDEDGKGLWRWREHDGADKPTHDVVVLCEPCADRIIGPHPRLYARLDRHQPHPGAMSVCDGCTHRDGVRCVNPMAKANGGTGVILTIPKPMNAHLCMRGSGRKSGWVTLWTGPVKACAQWEDAANGRRVESVEDDRCCSQGSGETDAEVPPGETADEEGPS